MGRLCKTHNCMKTLDEKSEEYSASLCNQSGTYTKGEIETAYVVGASENKELTIGELGTFGQALESLKRGFNVTREKWSRDVFVVKQIDSDISPDIVPRMQSIPYAAKEWIKKFADGSMHYDTQCLLVFPGMKGATATNYIPDWMDMFANDWMIVE